MTAQDVDETLSRITLYAVAIACTLWVVFGPTIGGSA